ncbi:glycosyltransferase family 9 protein [bacterium]|nr:MAG: glycosyltransferase family 9 protein [bacterium]
MGPGLRQKIELGIVELSKRTLNLVLGFWEKVLFPRKARSPQKILIFKVGNIGDIICAIPSFIAIRKNYPGAEITLLTSPGDKSIPGASELLYGARYLDRIIKYDVSDFDSFGNILRLIRKLKKEHYDVFINLPADSWASFRILFRNMIFARFLGVRASFGFRVRTIINLFKKTQIDYTLGRKETDTLLDILREGGVNIGDVEFDLPIPSGAEAKVREILAVKWGPKPPKLLIALQFATKANFPEKRWLPERFAEVLKYLMEKYDARIVIIGGPGDTKEAKLIARDLKAGNFLITAGELTVIESAALLKHCSFLLGIDSGPMHIMASFGKPTVSLFSTMNILGLWFPYGTNHEIIFHRFLDCDYRKRGCVRKSMELITVQEVESACDRLIQRLYRSRDKKQNE